MNAVTAELFQRYRSAEDYARADPAVLEREIHSTGFFKAKARALIGMGRALVERHGGVVPRTADELVALPGVGRKTAHVVLGNAFGRPGARRRHPRLPRVRSGSGSPGADDADEIHDQLCAVLPRAAMDAGHASADHPRPPHVFRAAAGVPALCGVIALPVAREDPESRRRAEDAPSPGSS